MAKAVVLGFDENGGKVPYLCGISGYCQGAGV